MQSVTSATAVAATARANDITLFASLELSKSKWVVTINSPGSEKFSNHVVEVGDGIGLLDRLSRSRAKAEQRYGVQIKAIVIQEAGLDGFWNSSPAAHQRDREPRGRSASIAVDRRHRRAKTDAIDGETLLRTLMAWARGARRVCSMVRAPSPEDEDRRRLTRERGTLLKERIQHTNRVEGLLSGQGVRDYNPLRCDRVERLEALRTGGGRELPPLLKAEIRRELDRIALVMTQLATVERARDALIRTEAEERNNPAALLIKFKGLGPEFASLLWLEALFRSFGNRRQVAAFAGLAPSPWQRGDVERDQGISKSGNRRLRKTMIELAWFWLRHQPDSALSRWFQARVGAAKGRVRRIAIVALARKLRRLWRYVTQGLVPEGAMFKAA
jgi:transposase